MRRVIGLGSPFGADRAAWEVIEQLRGHVPSDVELVALDRPGAALVNWLQGVERLILVDTLPGPPGTHGFCRLAPTDLAARPHRLDLHGQQVREALELASTLGQSPAVLEIYAILIVAETLQPDPADLPPGVPQLVAHLGRSLRETCFAALA